MAIHDGILYASDLSGFLYALDANTGEHFWTYDLLAAVWGSPYVADGRVYVNLQNAPTVADYYVYVGHYPNAVTWRRS